jgi:hypothetical protein
MREFSIYSTNQARWFSFVAPEGGTVADTIASNCWTVVSAQDNSSHQIITFGGTRTLAQVNSKDVWALTIPSFDWIQLDGNATDPTRAPGERIDPACATVGNRYMLSWGGRGSACDNEGNAVFLLDISQGKWVDDYKVDQEYLVPNAVVAVIGGTYAAPLLLPPSYHLTDPIPTVAKAERPSAHPQAASTTPPLKSC